MTKFASRRSLTRPLQSAAVLLAAFAANAAFAADPNAPKTGVISSPNEAVLTSIVALVVFALVFAFLATQVWPKIMGGLKDRENKIREEIESAEMARSQAKDALEQYQKSLAEGRAEAARMLEATKAQQIALAAELKAKADAELSAMRDRAMRDIEAAKRAAVAEVYASAAGLASIAAGKILRRNINQMDTERLIEESVRQLESTRS